jgi:hypothetical protein
MFLGKLNWTYFPYPFFNFNNAETTITFTQEGETKFIDLVQVPVTAMISERIFNQTTGSLDKASVTVCKSNGLFNYTQVTTMQKDVKFVNMSITLEGSVDGAVLVAASFKLETKGILVPFGGPTVAFFDEGAKVLGQLVFVKAQPDEPGTELLYPLEGRGKTEIELWAGVFSISDTATIYQDPELKASYLNGLVGENVDSYAEPEKDPNLRKEFDYFFDYQKALLSWNVSYIASRDSAMIPKFAKDPAFSLVFINDKVAVFIVKEIVN